MPRLQTYKNILKSVNEAEAVLEYRRDVTIRQYRQKLINNYYSEATAWQYLFQHEETADPEFVLGMIFAEFENLDNTSDHRYVPFLAKLYAAGIKIEDIATEGPSILALFDWLKRRNVLPNDKKDIMRFKTLAELRTVVDEYADKANEDDKVQLEQKGKAHELLDTEYVRVISPNDEAAAIYYGQGTKWCTSARNDNNMFEYYDNRGPLYIIIPKNPAYTHEKYQFHIESESYMNELDNDVNLYWFFNERFKDDKELYNFFNEKIEFDNLISFIPPEVLKEAALQAFYYVKDIYSRLLRLTHDHADDAIYRVMKEHGLRYYLRRDKEFILKLVYGAYEMPTKLDHCIKYIKSYHGNRIYDLAENDQAYGYRSNYGVALKRRLRMDINSYFDEESLRYIGPFLEGLLWNMALIRNEETGTYALYIDSGYSSNTSTTIEL